MKKQLLLTSALVILSAPSFASNLYVNGSLGKSKFGVDGASGSESDSTKSFGAGYKVNETWAIEANYRDFGGVGYSYTEDLGGGDYESVSFDSSFSSLEFSFVGSFPLSQVASLYGRLGFGNLKLEADFKYSERFDDEVYSESESGSESKTKAVLGVGFRYNFNDSIGARAEYSFYQDWDDLEISSTTIGLIYQF